MVDDISRTTDSDISAAWRVSIFGRLYVDHDGCDTKPLRPLLVGLALWLLFCIWFIGSHAYTILEPDALLYVLLASIWMLISPVLQAQAEHRFWSLMEQLKMSSERDGWRIDPIECCLFRANAFYWPISIGFALIFPVGFAAAQSFMEDTLSLDPLSAGMFYLGIVVMTGTGFTSGNGLWSALKVIYMFAKIDDTSTPAWYPLRVRQIHGYEELSKFALKTAWAFSFGALFAPIVFLAFREGRGSTVVLAAMGLVVLLFGAAALFLIPIYYLASLAERSRECQLELLADEIECLLSDDLPELCEDIEAVERRSSLSLTELLNLRNLLISVATLGRPVLLLWRVTLLVLIPAVVTIVPQVAFEFFG